MSAEVTVFATCTVASAVCVPILSSYGIDLPSGICGAVGVIIVQTFVPRDEDAAISYRRLAALTFASVLTAALVAPIVAQVLSSIAPTWLSVAQIRGVTAAIVGGFAQPIVLWSKRVGLPLLFGRLKALFGAKDA